MFEPAGDGAADRGGLPGGDDVDHGFYLSAEFIRGMTNVAFDDVVPEDDANGLSFRKKFGQPQRLGDPPLAFLVGVIHVLETEILAITQ